MAKKAPTKVPGIRARRERPVYTVSIEHPLAPASLDRASVTFRSLFWHEHEAIVKNRGETFAAVLALVKLAIVDWSLAGEPAALLDRMHEDTIRELHKHVRVVPNRSTRRRAK